ncbi:MAG: bifunctional 4-hydroxy-2-oxoglutarate aldolase/2-dehydro-3-deoxy-phosphogluconate aldolase [Agathobacter sp.]|nr:bifunctional 4-hydroxy-2-oxoglutarate aldolase/2-dehydro-3-deoxy-phosphogluconate aldolase [Agathobacter sp.]
MNEVLKQIDKIGIVPVVVLNDAKDAEPLAKALCEGGLPCAEVTFRTEAAEECIRIMSEKFPEMLVGAGTVLTTDQVDRAVAAGAKFIVSPGTNPRIVKYCVERNIPITPGTANPSDVEQALENGLEVVKFFPAEPLGGLKLIKAMAAPYVGVKFMPTGGINANNVREYLAYDRILACGGSWMVSSDLVKAGDFAKITELTREAAEIVKEIRG